MNDDVVGVYSASNINSKPIAQNYGNFEDLKFSKRGERNQSSCRKIY